MRRVLHTWRLLFAVLVSLGTMPVAVAAPGDAPIVSCCTTLPPRSPIVAFEFDVPNNQPAPIEKMRTMLDAYGFKLTTRGYSPEIALFDYLLHREDGTDVRVARVSLRGPVAVYLYSPAEGSSSWIQAWQSLQNAVAEYRPRAREASGAPLNPVH